MIEHYVWYEKYRPTTLGAVVLPPEQQVRFEQYIEDSNIPHLLFIGPPGSGKTTMAKVLMKHIPTQTLELNASSADRGIDTIRGKVTDFARSQSRPNTLKVIFFDEADKLTPDAQTALRNTIEATALSCRFIFTANFGDKIIDPIKSRCTIFTFEAFPKRLLFKKLNEILTTEGIQFERGDILKLIDRHYPDIRTVINNLQAGSLQGVFKPELANLTGNVNFDVLQQYLQEGKIKNLRELWAGTTDFSWLYRWLFNKVVPTMFLDDDIATAAIIVAEHMYRDAIVLDREINFTACCLELITGPLNVKAIWK